MSAPLTSLESFLDEPVTQELPRSFVAPALDGSHWAAGVTESFIAGASSPRSLGLAECASPRSATGAAQASRFANWRANMAARWAAARQRRIELQAKRDADKSAPLSSEVATLKAELEALRKEMRMMQSKGKNKNGSIGSSGSGDALDSSDSDAAPRAVSSTRSHRLSRAFHDRGTDRTTTACFDDASFGAWSEASESRRESGAGRITEIIRDGTSSEEEEEGRDTVKSLNLTPMTSFQKVLSDAGEGGFDDDAFAGWTSARGLPTTAVIGGQP